MEYSLNTVSIAGNVVSDIEVKTTPRNKKYCYVRIAVSRPYGGADLVSVRFWNTDAELCAAQLKKGDAVVAVGENTVESNDKADKKTYFNYLTGKLIAKILRPEASP